MKDPRTAFILSKIGPQEYSLADAGPVNRTNFNPLEAWTPPSHKRVFTVDEFYDLFKKECITFLGDSNERRAADTLHILLKNRHNISAIENYFYKHKNKDSDRTRPNVIDNEMRGRECTPGTVDNLFRPTYERLLEYDHLKQKNYTIVVASTGGWNQIGRYKWYTPDETRELIQTIIHRLHNQIPQDVLLVWKTSPWAWFGEWRELKGNETYEAKSGNNYMIHLGNQIAKDTILAINSPSRILIDYSTEIAPYSFEQRQRMHMEAENNDWVQWHMGSKARALYLQMLAWEVARFRNSSFLSAPRVDTSNTGDQTESAEMDSQHSDGTGLELSNVLHNDDNKENIKENFFTTTQTAESVTEAIGDNSDKLAASLVVNNSHSNRDPLPEFGNRIAMTQNQKVNDFIRATTQSQTSSSQMISLGMILILLQGMRMQRKRRGSRASRS